MATYVYETIPQKPGQKPKRYEIQHPMADPPLKKHPQTGEAIKRVIAGSMVVTRHAKPPRSTTDCGGDTSS